MPSDIPDVFLIWCARSRTIAIGMLVVTTFKEKHNSRIFRPSENLIENFGGDNRHENFGGDNRHENFGGDNRKRYSNNKTRTPIN